LEEIARTSPGWLVPLLQPGWDERYGRKVETARLLGRKNTSAQKLAEQIGADGQRLLDTIDADPAAAWINDLPQVRMVRLLWTQHYQATAAGRLRWKDAAELPVAAERPHSPYDPDARYTSKGEDIEWVGSKAHLSESCDDQGLPDLVTDVHTTPATDPDVTASAARGITLVALVTVRTGRNARQGTFPPAPSPSTGRPAPPAAPPARPAAPCARTSAAWSPSRSPAATAGPARSATSAPWRLPTSPAGSPSTPSVSTKPRMTAQRAQDTDQWRTTYNIRAGIEATVSQAARGPDLRHSRYRGLPKAHLQNVMLVLSCGVPTQLAVRVVEVAELDAARSQASRLSRCDLLLAPGQPAQGPVAAATMLVRAAQLVTRASSRSRSRSGR
jgi:hypothetical protein